MGISNYAVLCYGIVYEYDEIKHLMENPTIEKVHKGYRMSTLWEEMGFMYTSAYGDESEEYYYYFIGKTIRRDLTLKQFLQENNEDEMVKYLQGVCEKYNLVYQEPKILARANCG